MKNIVAAGLTRDCVCAMMKHIVPTDTEREIAYNDEERCCTTCVTPHFGWTRLQRAASGAGTPRQ